MEIKVAILDKNINDCNEIKTLINSVKKPSFKISKIELFNDDIFLKEDTFSTFDFLFVGISNTTAYILNFIEKLTTKYPSLHIILVSDEVKYALFGYEVGVSDYILKPVSVEQFTRKFVKILNRISKTQKQQKITLKSKNEGMVNVQISAISYIESRDHDLIFHSGDKAIVVRGNLKDYEKELKKYNFSRCNACYLVNINKVDCVIKDFLKIDEKMLKISQTKKKDFLEALANA